MRTKRRNVNSCLWFLGIQLDVSKRSSQICHHQSKNMSRNVFQDYKLPHAQMLR